MPIDKFGRRSDRAASTRPGLSLRLANNSFLRRDGGNIATGSINMGGNTLTNLSNPAEAQDVATKSYVDSNDASTKVAKSGDTMTGDLRLSVGTDRTRLLGCTDLTRGKEFSVVFGNVRNRLQFQVAPQARNQTPMILDTTHGFLVRSHGDNVCQIGTKENPPTIIVHKNIAMNSHRIVYLTEPVYAHEAVSKSYVDRKFENTAIKSYDGHIPPLEGNRSKTGFAVYASSFLDNDHQPWMAFNSASAVEWVTAGEGAGSWIQIYCPTSVRIWKIRLTGRASNQERITSWKLSGQSGDTFTDIYTSNVRLGSNMREFLINTSSSYNIYRLIVLSAEPGNTGLSHFQIFTMTYYEDN